MRDDTTHPSSPVTASDLVYDLISATQEHERRSGDKYYRIQFEEAREAVLAALAAPAPATALRRIEQDLRMYAAGLPDGDDLRSVLELAANDAASALRNAPARRAPVAWMETWPDGEVSYSKFNPGEKAEALGLTVTPLYALTSAQAPAQCAAMREALELIQKQVIERGGFRIEPNSGAMIVIANALKTERTVRDENAR